MTLPAITPKTVVQPDATPPQPRQFTFEEYCTYDDGTDNRYELVQGYLQLMTSPAGLHIVICEFLVYVFNKLFADTQTPFRAGKDIGVRTGKKTSRIVDVCVNGEDCWQEISQPGEVGIFLLAQTPLLVVEVTSTNEKTDYEAKYQEHASIGIPEYWIVNRKREHLRMCHSPSPGAAYTYQEFVRGERIVSRVLPQLKLTVDQVLNPPAVRQLIEQEKAQQAAAREAEREAFNAEKAAIAAERDALEAENVALQQQLEQLKALIAARELDSPLEDCQ